MHDLKIINKSGQLLVDSRDVAEMIGKRHTDLLRSIDGYVEILLNAKLRSVDFFIESTYKDTTGRTLKCYLLTRKGCDMVANKLTGEKGVLFTATYVTRFEEMEQQLKQRRVERLSEEELTIKKINAEAKMKNAMTKQAQFLLNEVLEKHANDISQEARQVVLSYATEIIAGKPLIPRPSLPEPHYTAKQIADELGVSANRIGRIAKQHNLKTEEYGKWILDKAKHCDKQVRTFIYNEKGKQKLLDVLNHQ